MDCNCFENAYPYCNNNCNNFYPHFEYPFDAECGCRCERPRCAPTCTDNPITAYGSFTAEGGVVVQPGDAVAFTAHGPKHNLSFSNNGYSVTFLQTGVYQINYAVVTSLSQLGRIELTLNGTPVAHSDVKIVVATGEEYGTLLLRCCAGEVLRLVVRDAAVTLAPEGTNAFLDIVRVA